jgi:beta-glucanase (GH16 family)
MTLKDFKKTNSRLLYPLIALIVAMAIGFAGCEKEEEDFSPAFSVEQMEDNWVRFENQSTGEYYWLIWDFGNGVKDTSDNKKQSYEIYFPEAGNFTPSLKLINYVGTSKETSQPLNIAESDLVVSFTAIPDASNPNYINLTNTSEGEYESFKWIFQDSEIANEAEVQAYFPLAGDYEVELELTSFGTPFSSKQVINIAQDDPDYNPLVWAEEFNYTGPPDPNNWNFEIGGDGWGNNELQYYTDRSTNANVANGVLTITALEEQEGGRDFTSARITTQNKFDFKYGRIEARIRLPYGQGIWPAFWMLGANFSTVGWPYCGEIDIMEMVGGEGKDNTTWATIHWDNDGTKADYGLSYTLPNGILADEFHVFAVEWDSEKIVAFIDDVEYFVADITPPALSEFQNNFFIILNVAVGGDWPGPPDASTTFPQTMEVDYVRVYQNP